MGSDNYHEPLELISEHTKDLHRAVVTLIEELEAFDWYQQRADACTDQALRAVLLHNRDEEVEHAMMTLEWLRRNSSVFAQNVATYVGTSGPITEIEANAEDEQGEPRPTTSSHNAAPTLGIGSLREARS